MKHYAIVGYVYEADIHCIRCARARFGDDALADPDTVDGEDNPLGVVFAGDESADAEHCGDCGAPLVW